jgi:hypothetical protein
LSPLVNSPFFLTTITHNGSSGWIGASVAQHYCSLCSTRTMPAP